jgi:hypothetical protein
MRAESLLSGYLFFVALLASAQADFYIDDANSSVQYTSILGLEPFGPLSLTDGNHLMSGNGSVVQLDYSRLYDNTA